MKTNLIPNTIARTFLRPRACVALALSLLFLLGGFTPLLAARPSASTAPQPTAPLSSSPPRHRALQKLSLEGEADVGTFIVSYDGALTAALISAGDGIGGLNPEGEHYSQTIFAAAMFRWGEYEDAINYFFEVMFNTSLDEGDGGMGGIFSSILGLLPPNSILIFFSGSATPLQTLEWGNTIHLEYENALGIPYEHIIGIPPITIGSMTVAVEAYGYAGTPDEGRDVYQSFMADLGTTRDGMSELCTPTLAEDSMGGFGLYGVINPSSFAPESRSASQRQIPGAITTASWVSSHRDEFYGDEYQIFDLNEFTGHTGTIDFGTSLDALQFVTMFPTDTVIHNYTPTDMTIINSTGPTAPEIVERSNSTWQAAPSIPNIVINFTGDFPPGLFIEKTITPDPLAPDQAATVTLLITNEDDETLYNIYINDTLAWALYADTGRYTISGSMSQNITSLDPGESFSLTYHITFNTEGTYLSAPAQLVFEDNETITYQKASLKVYVTVAYASIIDFLLALLTDYPTSLPLLLLLGLLALYLVIWTLKALFGLRKKPRTTPRYGPAPKRPSSKPAQPGSSTKASEPLYPSTTPEMSGAICIHCGSPLPLGVSFCPACGGSVE